MLMSEMFLCLLSPIRDMKGTYRTLNNNNTIKSHHLYDESEWAMCSRALFIPHRGERSELRVIYIVRSVALISIHYSKI